MARPGIFLIALLLALLPAAGYAQENEVSDGFVMRVEGDLIVPEGETVDAAIVIDGLVQIDGTVEDFLLVVDGYTEVTGRVNGDIISISSDVDVRNGAVVEGDITIIRGSVRQAAGAQVLGDVNDNFPLDWWQILIINIVLWIGLTIAVLVFGLLFVAVAPRQATSAAALMRGELAWSVISAFITFVFVPVFAVIALVTVVGLWLGLGLLIFVLPAVWFVGYLVAGLMLGKLILSRAGVGLRDNRFVVVSAGLGIMQLVLLIPFLGVLVVLVAGAWGAGALMLLAWRSFRMTQNATPTPA